MKSFICSRISLGFLSALLFFAWSVVPSVSAATPWDNVLNPTTELKLVSANGTHQIPLTTEYVSYMLERCGSTLYNSFTSALSNPNGRWVIIQEENLISGSPYTQIRIGWSTNPAHTTAFNQQGSVYSIVVPTEKAVVMLVENNGNKLCGENGSGSPLPLGIAPQSQITRIFLSTYPATYPSGYEGQEIPGQAFLFLDYMKYKIIDKVGEFTPKEIDKEKITKCTLFIDENPAVEPDDGEVSEAVYEINDCESTVTHQWSQYGTYYVRLELEHDDGVRQYTQTFTVDGRTYEGSFDDEGNEDATAINYEDCSVYGADIVAGIGCQFRNFGKWLQALFVSLFVPAPGYMSSFFGELRDFFTSKLGFLFWPVGFAIDLVSAFFQGTSGTLAICNWSFGNVFGREFKLNFCSFEQSFPVQFNTARYIIQAFTVFALVTGLYREYRRILTRS